ncbi:THUMP domain-containing class I SAM-dependent RNA methyltransferase [Bdellovibrio sp. HCB337]|uniref:THUMP domain-containing class I SAM-dependent RNA methyltransferase n=1 Tax=Bdellovibrio sp. HCB337 TaxID=3394358 RepID=UPI0039A6ED85
MKEQNLSRFYISCNLGFEENLAAEIRECWPWLIEITGQANQSAVPEMVFEKGGVLITTSFELGVQLNFFLKTAHRVLWRLAEFKVRDFPKLFEKVQKIPWNNYLASSQVEWVVAASKSRLNHEKRIEETCKDAFSKIAAKIQGNATAASAVYVRIFDDLCTISLDTSGENLHKRGWGALKGEAPLRETLAAFLLREFIGDEPPGKMQEVTLVDPMCGSGTLLLEAVSLWLPVFNRDFSFLQWKNTPKIFKSPLLKKNYKLLATKTPFKAHLGFDLDEKTLLAAKENYKTLQEKVDLPATDLRFEKENLFSGDPRKLGSVWSISNPPYGERLHVQGQDVFSYQDLINTMASKFGSEKVGVLLPNKTMVRSLLAPSGLRKVKELPFSNGGLDVVFLVFSK